MKKRHPVKNKVLLVNITRLGDMLQATPTIAGMKAENEQCRVTVLVEKQFEAVCHIIPNIDEIISIDLGMTVRSLAREQDGIVDAFEYVDEFVRDLRQRQFDYCLNMSSSGYTALLLSLLNIGRNGGWTADDEGYRMIESDWARLFASSVFHQNRQYNSLNLVDIFRCSADIEQHPNQLLIKVLPESITYAEGLIRDAAFTNSGPLIAIQAGASQAKRQWSPAKFVRLIQLLLAEQQARVVLIGSKKELPIIEQIKANCPSENVAILAGKTDIPQLSAVLKLSQILITGDTGPMHMSVAVGTPVIAMFLASAYGFETGPYSAGNVLIQPVIGCGPCNPNKPCAGLECHDTIDPELVAYLTARRLREEFTSVPDTIADPSRVIVYRSCFDEYGFCDFRAMNSTRFDSLKKYRDAYRQMWLDDLGGLAKQPQPKAGESLQVLGGVLEGLEQIIAQAQGGAKLIRDLMQLIQDPRAPAAALHQVNRALAEGDRQIEQIGFHFPYLGPLSRMFVFAKENLCGSEALDLASQMGSVYEDLIRRGHKLAYYMNQ